MADDDDDIDGDELEQALPDESLSTRFADPQKTVDDRIPVDLHNKYEFFSYKNAVVILSETRADEWAEIVDALRAFTLTTRVIRSAGGNESEVPKRVNALLRPKGWHETIVRGDLHIRLLWKEDPYARNAYHDARLMPPAKRGLVSYCYWRGQSHCLCPF